MSAYDPLVGQVLDDRYEILAKLARGGMATVYRARDLRLTRVVAVKIMRSDLDEDDEFAAKFDREARAAATINHPAVVGVFDQGVSHGQPYIVMEYIDGETLRRRISREAPLPPREALDLIEPVVSALACAHEHGLVHRDIKPENVLISTRGQVKVADFGLARLTTSPQMTATGVLVGTASYLPPELVTHSRPDSRSDVYSTGVVLFELLTGKKPHTGENNYQIAYRHVNVDVPAPSEYLTEQGHQSWHVPDYVDALVQAATVRNPERRIGDARELLDRVREVRNRLARNPEVNDPDLTVKLAPVVADDDEATVNISPRAARRPRPLSGPSPTTTQRSRSLSAESVSSPSSAMREESGGLALATRSPGSPGTPSTPRTPRSPEESWEPVRPPRTVVRESSAISHRSEDSLRERLPRVVRTPVFPTLTISRDPVHRRRRGVILVVLLVLVTVGVGLGSWWWADGRFTTMPAVAMTSEFDAEAAVESRGLSSSFHDEYSETVADGLVISSDPEAGARLLRGDTVTINLSIGPERYNVPQLEGLRLEQAGEALNDANLELGEVTEAFSETVADGVVLSASVDEGTPLKPGESVDVEVSKGREPISITDYTGRSAETAVSELEEAGFDVAVTEENSGSVEAGQVITQTPNSGSGFRGDEIALVRSLGPVMVEIPDVRYEPVDDAVTALENKGFKVERKYLTDLPLSLGIVSGTDPARGSSVPEGSTVTVLIA